MEKWQRARNSEQKAKREEKILLAAEKLFHEKSFEKITMQMIARESGFSQSNLYRYFKTREEVFLKLYMTDLRIWGEEIKESFSAKLPISDFVALWTEILWRHERLLELSPLLAVILEKNTGEELYRETKLNFMEQLSTLFPVVQTALPQLKDDMLFDFMYTHASLLAGGRPMAHYSEMQERVIDELNIPQIKLDFKKFYQRTLTNYLIGLLA